jgi:hypothetical protein
MNRKSALGSLLPLVTLIFGKPKKQSPAKCEDDVDRTLDRTVYAIFGGDGRPVDAVAYGVSAMVRLEPLLKGANRKLRWSLLPLSRNSLKKEGNLLGLV